MGSHRFRSGTLLCKITVMVFLSHGQGELWPAMLYAILAVCTNPGYHSCIIGSGMSRVPSLPEKVASFLNLFQEEFWTFAQMDSIV
jgi:hypothetical protein